jgi:histidinol-phosphate aminotransferase
VYALLETEWAPLDLCARLAPLLDEVCGPAAPAGGADSQQPASAGPLAPVTPACPVASAADLSSYRAPLQRAAVLRTLQQLGRVYSTLPLAALADLVGERTRVVWIANPNNPTGTWLAANPLRTFIAGLPKTCVVVVDEAYTEYVDEPDFPDATHWLGDFTNLIVTRTFSKIHGLAGLRVGYSLSDPHVADLLNRVRQPFNVNSLAQAAAVAALGDQEHVRATVEMNRAGMRQLSAGFERLGLDYIPSVGNFITVGFGQPAGPINDALLRRGVIVRPIGGYGLPNHLRISIGLEEENARCLAALEDILPS